MTLEETIAALLEAKLAPLVESNRRLAAEVERLRESLPAQLVTQAEAAKRLGLSVSTVKRRVRDGTLPVRRFGGSVRVDLMAAQRGTKESDVVRLAADSRSL